MDITKLLFSLIRSEIKGNEISDEIKDSISVDMLSKLYSLARKHDIAHILGEALSKVGLPADAKVSKDFKKTTFTAFYRYEQFKYELNRIYEALNNANISFVPLKGAIIRDYYPKPWLRTSCDIDILVHEEALEHAVSVLETEYKFVADKKKNYHDISLFSPSGVHLELHFNILENIQSLDGVLMKVWEYVTVSEDMNYKYEMTNEFLMFHIIAHLSYHFLTGGGGIRPFIDLWLLENALEFDKDILNKLLTEANLLKFYESVKSLASIWMNDEPYTDIAKQMEEYIFIGGAYGSLQNKVIVQQQKKNGKLSYIIHRVFLSYDNLKTLYPVIQKKRWLIPFLQVHRWFRRVFAGRAKYAIQEITYNKNVSKSKADKMKVFLEEIGL